MTSTPKSLRLHLAIFGRRNTGKSTLLNLAAGQEISIVSPTPGTTTDPVEKSMEFHPLGPVLWLDTAGLDDTGELGTLRAKHAQKIIERTDLAIIVFAATWSEFEQNLYQDFTARKIPVVVVANKIDLEEIPCGQNPKEKPEDYGAPKEARLVRMAAAKGVGLGEFRQAIIAATPADFLEPAALARDLLPPGSLVILVTPIDSEAPKGRLILPQVQVLRDLLDGDCRALVCKETGVAAALKDLARPPALVITDSQAFAVVAKAVPETVPLTGFSVLMARAKGNLAAFAAGAAGIDLLKDGDRVLVAESCAHYASHEDIGRVKLPALLRKKSGAKLEFDFVTGHDFPGDLHRYALVLHCGACMTNRREVLSRLARAEEAGVPMVNYGLAIAYCQGLLARALGPFPAAAAAFSAGKSRR